MDAEELNDAIPRRQRPPRDAFSLNDNSFIKLFRLNQIKQTTDQKCHKKIAPINTGTK